MTSGDTLGGTLGRPGQGLPEEFLELADGSRLDEKIGHTFLLVVGQEESWPHLAMLSVGEVFAGASERVCLALHAHSGTSRALGAAGRALLFTVIDRRAIKVRLTTRIAGEPSSVDPRVYFIGDVEAVATDAVGYATVTDGVRYSLEEPVTVLQRWETTLDVMRQLSSSDTRG